jgi:hypothetical protein
MGYIASNTRRPWLVLDIETAPILDIDRYADDVRIDSRLKDPEKVAAARKEALGKAALDIDLLRIVALGAWASDSMAPYCFVAGDVTDGEPWPAQGRGEGDYLTCFWDDYQTIVVERGGLLVTSNGIGFDVPALLRRSQYLGVTHPHVEVDKYRTADHLDLQHTLSFRGSKPWRSLDFYCRRFGIAEYLPDPTTGADIGGMVEAGDIEGIRAHCLADVRRTQALAQRLGYIGAPVPAHAEVSA